MNIDIHHSAADANYAHKQKRGCYRLWSPYGIGQTIIFLPWFLLSYSSFFLSSPNLSRRTLDVCITSTHGVALVRISDAGLKRAAHGSLQIQEAKSRQKSPSAHHHTTLSGYIFATKARIDNRAKLLSSNISSKCPHKMANFGQLAAEIDPVVWGIPANFNGFRVLAGLLHGTPVVGISQTLQR